MRRRGPLFLLLIILAMPGTAQAGNKLPDWAKPLAEIDCSQYDTTKVDAVCLLDQNQLTVNPSGKLVHHARMAYRVLTTAGESYGSTVLPHNTRSRIRQARAWVLYPNGKSKAIKEGDTIDTQLSESTLFTDARKRIIPLPGVTKGSVVCFEWELEEVEEFMRLLWRFQSDIPILESELTFDLPAGVDLQWQAYNMAAGYQPQVSGSHYRFHRTNVPALPDEDWAPSTFDLVEQVALRFHSPSGGTPACDNWADAARWYYNLTKDQWPIPQEVKDLSAEICKGAADDGEKIRRLCRWVQSKVRYVAIAIDLGGYVPHAQADVCRNKYGDCKDKSFLLMGLLRSQGVTTWPVLCRLGSRGNVDPDFAWPGQFDHCITAIEVPGEGLRYFDPTSELVVFPCLPASLEGAMGLLVREDGGELLPMTSGIVPYLEVLVEAELTSAGHLTATVSETYSLAALRGVRARYRSMSEEERHQGWEEWLARRIPGVKLRELHWVNLHDAEKDLVIEYSLSAPGLAKQMGNLLMFNPFFIQDVGKPSFGQDKRELPVSLHGAAIQTRQEVRIKLPADLAVEESVEPCSLTRDFGTFEASSTEGDRTLTLVKEFTLQGATVPADRYTEVKSFFSAVNNVERTEILFVSE